MPYKIGFKREPYRLSGKRLGLEKEGWELISCRVYEKEGRVVAAGPTLDNAKWQARWGGDKHTIYWYKSFVGWEKVSWYALMTSGYVHNDNAYLIVEDYEYWGWDVIGLLRPSKVQYSKFDLHFLNPMDNEWTEGELWHGSARQLITQAATCFQRAGYK